MEKDKSESVQPIVNATSVSKKWHGVNCPKVAHDGVGYLHAFDDDGPYDVDGVPYCGRCHLYLPPIEETAIPRKENLKMTKWTWFRTKDHLAANDRTPVIGERQWNVDFESDRGENIRIHVGPESRKAMLEMLCEEKAKTVTADYEGLDR